MSSVPVVPLSITPSYDTAKGNSDSSSHVSPSTPNRSPSQGQGPPLPLRTPSGVTSKVQSRINSTQMRQSRTASLIIPVVSTTLPCEEPDDKTDDFVDLDRTFNNDIPPQSSRSQTPTDTKEPDSPILPARPPKTPVRPSRSEFEPQPLQQYGMDRVEAPMFSPTSLKTSRSRNSVDAFAADTSDGENTKHTKDEPIGVQNEKFMIQQRKYQVDYITNLLTKARLTVPTNVYFEKIHSSNSYIEVLSEIRSGSYETANLPTLYSLLLNSLKIKETSFNHDIQLDEKTKDTFSELIQSLSFLLRSTSEQKLKFQNDIVRLYSLFTLTDAVTKNEMDEYEYEIKEKQIVPNPLVAAFVYRCASPNILPQALVVALMINTFIITPCNESREFQFLLLRSVESIDSGLLLLNLENNMNPVAYINSLISSNSFWCDLIFQLYQNDNSSKNDPLGLTNILNNLVIYGVYSLIEVIVNLRYKLDIFGCKRDDASDNNEYVLANLVRYHREFLILNESASSQLTTYTLEKLSRRNQELQDILQEKNTRYNELLNNYKQLNEEKMSVSDLLERAQSENATLSATKRSISAQVDQLLGQFDVIKQTIEKTKRVQELNDSMSKEIERLSLENQRLKK